MKKKYLLSVIIPVFNEEETISQVLLKVKKTKHDKEIIVVNDGSTDKTGQILKKEKRIILINLPKNYGKGFALRKGIKAANGNIIIVQDADLEYDPVDFDKLIAPIIGGAKVVYGSRFAKNQKEMFLTQKFANKILTLLTNLLFGSSISDMETGYKVFASGVIKNLNWRAKRFDFEPEITAKILKAGIKIYEVPITYHSRGYQEGKKITWFDGLVALKSLFWYRFFD